MPDLQALSVAGEGEFALLLADGARVDVAQVVRRIPGRRLVCRGVWQGHPVYVKIFIGDAHAKYAGRDRRGVEWLKAGGILTPALLDSSSPREGKGTVLVFEAIDADNAESLLHAAEAEPERQRALAARLVALVAAHHAAGLCQQDQYLKNYLVRGDEAYTLDGDGIRSGRMTRRQAMKNLAMLLSKFPPELDAGLDGYWALYARARGWQAQTGDIVRLAGWVSAMRRANAEGYARKVLRACTDVAVHERGATRMLVARAYDRPEFLPLIERPGDFLEAADSRRLKSGGSATVGMVQAGTTPVVVKRYNSRGLLQDWRRELTGKNRAEISWRNAHRLRELGIATPDPVAFVRTRTGFGRYRSYFLCGYSDAPDALQFFADPAVGEEKRLQVAGWIARLMYRLYLVRIEHSDMKGTNLKVGTREIILIDLDGMRQFRSATLFLRRHKKDLSRLLRNWSGDEETARLVGEALSAAYAAEPQLAAFIRNLMPRGK